MVMMMHGPDAVLSPSFRRRFSLLSERFRRKNGPPVPDAVKAVLARAKAVLQTILRGQQHNLKFLRLGILLGMVVALLVCQLFLLREAPCAGE